jgi:hypothetical protein
MCQATIKKIINDFQVGKEYLAEGEGKSVLKIWKKSCGTGFW